MNRSPYRKILVTGGAGFIGSHLVRTLLEKQHEVLCFDKLSYAGNRCSLSDHEHNPQLTWAVEDLNNLPLLKQTIRQFQPDAILHLAAESHVDRSIETSIPFAQSNATGTASLLEAALEFWRSLPDPRRSHFRVVYMSTDEVFGSINTPEQRPFNEESPYRPNSPYSASKAAGDLFVRAFRETHKLPAAILWSSNNYGSFQHPEKLIPKSISLATAGKPIPVYGSGENVRDWLHVSDAVAAIEAILYAPTERFQDYAIGGGTPLTNLSILKLICQELDRLKPRESNQSHYERIQFVEDRAGHDWKYEIDFTKIREQLGWKPKIELTQGIADTVEWYLANAHWTEMAHQKL